MTITRLALFDLDHTLLPIDSADGWSHFLIQAAGLDDAEGGAGFRDLIRRFAADYKAGRDLQIVEVILEDGDSLIDDLYAVLWSDG